jgi:hypothetical protein
LDGKSYWQADKNATARLKSGTITGVVENVSLLIDPFVEENTAEGKCPTNFSEVLTKSPEDHQWDMKNSGLLSSSSAYIYNDLAHNDDYIGNVAWGQIMNESDWPQTAATMGAGFYQTVSPNSTGKPAWTNVSGFFDDPLDTKAIKEGYDR